MKYVIVISISFLIFQKAAAQYNFIYNGSFEQYASLPDNEGELYRCLGWNEAESDTNFNGLSDYYNLKADFFGNMPNTIFSYIIPQDEQAAAGFYTYDSIADYREYIGCKLQVPLHPNLDYRVSFYLSMGSNYKNKYLCNNVGFAFTNNQLVQPVPFIFLGAIPQVETDTVFADSLWHRYTFHFTPKSRYSYLTIGNFRSNFNSSVAKYGSGKINGAYIFIDSITVTTKFYAFKDTTICRDDSVRLYAIGDNSFAWTEKNFPQNILSTDSFVVVHPNQTTTYIVHGTGSNVDTVTVKVEKPPQIFLGVDTTLCDTNKIVIGDTCLDCTYAWNTGETSSYITISNGGNFILTGTNVCNATSDSKLIQVVQKPLVPLHDTIFCSGDSIVLSAYHPGASYSWSTESDNPSIVVNKPGTYSVNLDDSSCNYSYKAYVQSFPKPQLFIGNDTAICNGNTLSLNARGMFDSVRWWNGSTNTLMVNVPPGNYFATAVNSCGAVTDSIQIGVEECPTINVPTAFTPNGDAINDLLTLEYPALRNFSMKIFNRWGQLIFSTQDPNDSWDGTNKGHPVPMGTYAYVINAFSGEGLEISKTGSVVLIR